jgi:hypothetical protein
MGSSRSDSPRADSTGQSAAGGDHPAPQRRRAAWTAVLLALVVGCAWIVARGQARPAAPLPRSAIRWTAPQATVQSQPGERPPAPAAVPPPPSAVTPEPAASSTRGGEWEGMPIDRSSAPYCEASERCGLARACVESVCTACGADRDCATGEACVLEHCVLTRLAECRSRADCPAGDLCILSGYSPDPRGNADMRASCASPRSGTATRPDVPMPPVDPRTSLPHDALRARARKALAQE